MAAAERIDGQTILLVEDEVLIRWAVADSLREARFAVLEVGDGDAGRACLETKAIDLVISDLMMPGRLDGLGLARWIDEHRPGLALLMVSGNPPKRDPTIRSMLWPPLLKPCPSDDLIAAARSALARA